MRRAIAVIGYAVCALSIESQQTELEDALRDLLENALEVKVVATVLPPNSQPVWNMEKTELTIPGRSVDIQITGKNIRVHAVFTPYRNEDDDLILVAQGQIWLSEPPEQEIRYASTYRSIPISLGEKILFFPLGMSGEIVDTEFTLRVEIQIVPHTPETSEDGTSQ